MVRDRLKRFFRREPSDKDDHSDKDDLKHLVSRQGTHPVEDSSIDHHASISTTKPDLWQRAFDDLEPKEQQLIQSILIPESTNIIDSSDANIDPGVVDRLKALNGVVETVKTQYEIDQQKSKIKEPTQKIIKAVLSFQDLIQAAVAFDPTGHATSVWAIVSLGLTMTQNYRSQKVAWLESSVFLADILTRYGFVEQDYQKYPNTDQHVETALVQVYIAVLTFAAKVQSFSDRSHTVLIWKSISGDTLSDLENSIDQAESHLGQWLEIVDRREQAQLLKKADEMLTNIDKVMDSLNELNGNMVLAELKIAEQAHYNAYTGEEYQECLPETRADLLQDIRSWATDPEKKPVFWLQGMAGTGKSTVSRTVAQWLDNEGLLGGSFFFKKGGTDREDAKRLFTTLTKQILGRLPHLQKPVQKVIKETRGIGSNRLQEQFDELFFKPLKSLHLGLKSPLILVVVIDALDECQVSADITAFLSTLPKLNHLTDVRMRFFITSRPEPTVIKGFRTIGNDEIVAKTLLGHKNPVSHHMNLCGEQRNKRSTDCSDTDQQRSIHSEYSEYTHSDYTVGWICALPIEMSAAKAMLEEIHPNITAHSSDTNHYILGRIGDHNIVLACLPHGVYGTTSAAVVAIHMLYTFNRIRIGLMVGIGGGVPSAKNDIRLGDVVVSSPTGCFGGVIQHDLGKNVGHKIQMTGALNKPPQSLLVAIARLRTEHLIAGNRISQFVEEMLTKNPTMRSEFTCPSPNQDRLFEADYDHFGNPATCDQCDQSREVARPSRTCSGPQIHYGLIASGNQVMRDGRTRDRLAQEPGILCFEMEAAGLMDNFPCLVVRGVCDYADSHKNKDWQGYAAATAAGYAKDLLSVISGPQIYSIPVAVTSASGDHA